MSNPEKRDERSMSDILASIRKIMAQEPAGPAAPSLTRTSLNGVSGAALDLPREPELKLPSRESAPETTAAEPVSLDELLAETARTASPPPSPAKPAVPARDERPAGGTTSIGGAATAPGSAEAPVEPASSRPDTEASPAIGTIGPPAPKLGDLGSVVPGKLGGDGAGRASAATHAIAPPLAGPLLGEPTRTPASNDPLPEVPGADALRRLIAGVIPPSAHPSVAPAGKAPEPPRPEPVPVVPPAASAAPAAPAPRPPESNKSTLAPKPVLEAKSDLKPEPKAPLPQPPVDKKVDVEKPAATPTPSLAAAAVSAPAPAPKPTLPSSVPTRAAKLEAPAPAPAATPAPTAAAPAPAPTTTRPSGKTMDETVVELLRPLLRDWLNANMPRLIEPALKAELEALRSTVEKDKKG